MLHRCSVLKLRPLWLMLMVIFCCTGAVLLSLMLNYTAQVQCFEASAPLVDADVDILLHRCDVLKLRPL